MSRMLGSRPRGASPGGNVTTGGSLSLDDPAVRWSLWLGAGVLFGLGLGFLLGLTRPRPRVTP